MWLKNNFQTLGVCFLDWSVVFVQRLSECVMVKLFCCVWIIFKRFLSLRISKIIVSRSSKLKSKFPCFSFISLEPVRICSCLSFRSSVTVCNETNQHIFLCFCKFTYENLIVKRRKAMSNCQRNVNFVYSSFFFFFIQIQKSHNIVSRKRRHFFDIVFYVYMSQKKLNLVF